MAGKGDTPRPMAIDAETYRRNWDIAFERVKHEQPEDNICCVCGRDYSTVYTKDGKCLCDHDDCPCLKMRD